MLERIRNSFPAWGWLLPSLLPLTQFGGRGLFNSLTAVYFLWACLALVRTVPRRLPLPLRLFACLLLAYLLGVPFAEDAGRALRKWLGFAVMASTFGFSWWVLQQRGRDGLDQLMTALGWMGLATVLLAYLHLGVLLGRGPLEPTVTLKEDSFPYLLPFMLLVCMRRTPISSATGKVLLAGIVLLTGFYVFLSEGRSAQLGFAVSILLSLLLVVQLRWYKAVLLAGAVLGVTILGNPDTFLQSEGSQQDIDALLSQVSSHRWEIWQTALANASWDNFIGIGIGNLESEIALQTVLQSGNASHLHNFVLDAWYETGWFGLLALSVFLATGLYAGVRVICYGDEQQRGFAGPPLAAAAAILTSGLFSFSYSSKQFAVYLMICLVILMYLDTTLRDSE